MIRKQCSGSVKNASALITARHSVCEQLESRRLLSAGDLDLSFSGDGKTTTDFATGLADRGSDVAVQSDGKTIVVGYGMARYNRDGSLDTTFGSAHTGKVPEAHASSVAIQPDGKIVLGMSSLTHNELTVHRYLASGVLDTSFSGDGKATFLGEHGSVFSSNTQDVIIQKDGKILVVGFLLEGGLVDADEDFAIARFNSNGTLDTSFGSGGIRYAGFGDNDYGYAVAIDYLSAPTSPLYGTIVIAGYQHFTSLTAHNIAVARLKSNGAFDTSFSGDGKVITSFQLKSTEATAVVIQPGGKIVVAGTAKSSAGGASAGNFALVRYTSSGALDTTFGSSSDGRVEIDMGGDDQAKDIMVASTGQLIVGGYGGGKFAIAVLSKNGVLDPNYGSGGKIFTTFGTTSGINGLAAAPGNKFVAVGDTTTGGLKNVAIARYFDSATAVNVASFDPNASETGANPASFIVTRSDYLPVATRVYYSLGGTATKPSNTPGTAADYTGVSSLPIAQYVDILPGENFATVTITPVNDTLVEAVETVVITILTDANYSLGSTVSTTLSIFDNDPTTYFRVNAGGGSYVDYSSATPVTEGRTVAPSGFTGVIYEADNGFTGGTTSQSPYPVANTTDDYLFYTRRYGSDFRFSKAIGSAPHTLQLSFSESIYTAVGQRKFDVYAEGMLILNDFDIFAEAGGKTAITKTFSIYVTDSKVDLRFVGVVGDAVISTIVVT